MHWRAPLARNQLKHFLSASIAEKFKKSLQAFRGKSETESSETKHFQIIPKCNACLTNHFECFNFNWELIITFCNIPTTELRFVGLLQVYIYYVWLACSWLSLRSMSVHVCSSTSRVRFAGADKLDSGFHSSGVKVKWAAILCCCVTAKLKSAAVRRSRADFRSQWRTYLIWFPAAVSTIALEVYTQGALKMLVLTFLNFTCVFLPRYYAEYLLDIVT